MLSLSTWLPSRPGHPQARSGRQLIPTGAAATEADAIALRDGFRKQISEHTAVRTNITLRVLLAEWLAGHQVEPSTRASYALLIDKFILPALGHRTSPALAKLGPRPYEKLYAELQSCRRRCCGKPFTEHRTSRPHECDERCTTHAWPTSSASAPTCTPCAHYSATELLASGVDFGSLPFMIAASVPYSSA